MGKLNYTSNSYFEGSFEKNKRQRGTLVVGEGDRTLMNDLDPGFYTIDGVNGKFDE